MSDPEADILDHYNGFMEYASKKIVYMKRGTNPVPKSIKRRGKHYSIKLIIASFKIIFFYIYNFIFILVGKKRKDNVSDSHDNTRGSINRDDLKRLKREKKNVDSTTLYKGTFT